MINLISCQVFDFNVGITCNMLQEEGKVGVCDEDPGIRVCSAAKMNFEKAGE